MRTGARGADFRANPDDRSLVRIPFVVVVVVVVVVVLVVDDGVSGDGDVRRGWDVRDGESESGFIRGFEVGVVSGFGRVEFL
jgi:hypothetical protein